jgi:prepilin-type N-terminal cleavage/methylation domain-containing protein
MIKRKPQQEIHPSGESGFTIIESLVALLVVAILLTAIAPVIVLATATRVQSRRVELATRAVKTYIDGVRTESITPPSAIVTLAAPTASAQRSVLDRPAVAAVAATATTAAIPATLAITGSPGDYLTTLTSMPSPTALTASTLYCFNNSGSISNPDCTSNTDKLFYIQAGRIVQSSSTNDGYRLAIRVYRADADFTKTLTASTGSTPKNTQRTFTSGLGDRQAPLIEMTTDVASNTTSFKALCQRLGVATNQDCK